jgi:lysophospholipase L1-like esterase
LINPIKNILLVIVSITIALLIAEITARLYLSDTNNAGSTGNVYKFHEFNSELGWKNKANSYGFLEREEFTYKVNINSLGMRDKEISIDKPKGKQRIAVMGDSFTWGVGVAESDRFTNILENKSNGKYEVLNFGVSGYGPIQYLVQLDKILKFNPDIVFLTFCLGNDFADNVFFQRYGYYKPFTILSDNPEIEIHGYPLPKIGQFYSYLKIPFLNNIFENSKLIYLTNLVLRNINTKQIGPSLFVYKNQKNFSQAGHIGADEYQKDIYFPNHSPNAKLFSQDMSDVNSKILSKIKEKLELANIEFLIVIIPTKCEYGACFPPYDYKKNNNARNLLINNLQKYKISYFDPVDLINLNEFWLTDMHLRPSGHIKIADGILKAINNEFWLTDMHLRPSGHIRIADGISLYE